MSKVKAKQSDKQASRSRHLESKDQALDQDKWSSSTMRSDRCARLNGASVTRESVNP